MNEPRSRKRNAEEHRQTVRKQDPHAQTGQRGQPDTSTHPVSKHQTGLTGQPTSSDNQDALGMSASNCASSSPRRCAPPSDDEALSATGFHPAVHGFQAAGAFSVGNVSSSSCLDRPPVPASSSSPSAPSVDRSTATTGVLSSAASADFFSHPGEDVSASSSPQSHQRNVHSSIISSSSNNYGEGAVEVNPCNMSKSINSLLLQLFGDDPHAILSGCLGVAKKQFIDRYGSTDAYFHAIKQHLSQQRSSVSVLPVDILHHITGFLLDDPRTLGRMAQVCKDWNYMISRSCLWRKVCQRMFGCCKSRYCMCPSAKPTQLLFQLLGQQNFRPSLLQVVPLVKAGAQVNEPNGPRKVMPLHLAAYHGHGHVVEWLIERHGCDKNLRSGCGKTPLMMACFGNQRNVAAQLVQLGANLNDRDETGTTALMCAAQGGANCVVAWLRTQNIDFNVRNEDGASALHIAAKFGKTECLPHLLTDRERLSSRTLYGETPVLMAARRAKGEALKFLLKHGGSIQDRTSDGCSVLHLIALGETFPYREDPECHARALECLTGTFRLNMNDTDSFGNTPLHYALLNNNQRIAAVLRRLGATDNVANEFGATPEDHVAIFRALRNKETPRIRQLLSRLTGLTLTMNSTARDNIGNTEFRELVKVLATNRTVKTVRLMYTNIDVRVEEQHLLTMFESNYTLTELYLGEKMKQQLPDIILERLDRNKLLSDHCDPPGRQPAAEEEHLGGSAAS